MKRVKKTKEKPIRQKVKPGIFQILFMVINTLLVIGILGFYLGRTIYYKNYFESLANTGIERLTLSSLITEKADLTVVSDGLIKNDDGSFIYKGFATNNYVKYGSEVYRIMYIDTEGNMTMVSENTLFSFMMNDKKDFPDSSLNMYLNSQADDEFSGFFEDKVIDTTANLSTGNMCLDVVDSVDKIGCSFRRSGSTFSLLSLNDYKEIGGSDSYLNTGEEYWLLNHDSNGNYWFVDKDGNVSVNNVTSTFRGVRVVVTMYFSVMAQGGNGTKDNPYIVEPQEVTTVSDLSSQQYISYSGMRWKVSFKENGNVIVMLDGVIESNGAPLQRSYGTTYKYTTDSGVGKYLNTTFLSTLNNYKKYLVENNWYDGKYMTLDGYSYKDGLASTVKCYVSLPNQAYPGFDEYKNIFVSTRPYESSKIIYTLSEHNTLYAVLLKSKANVRPVICIKGDISIIGGSGTSEDPFVMGEPN